MKNPRHAHLGNRERQIMEAVYRLGRATVTDVLRQLDDPPSYSAVRAMLRILEDKGLLRLEQDGPRYVYRPTVSSAKARRSILNDLVTRLFDGSTEQAMAALIESSDTRLSDSELDRLERMIRSARRQGR